MRGFQTSILTVTTRDVALKVLGNAMLGVPNEQQNVFSIMPDSVKMDIFEQLKV